MLLCECVTGNHHGHRNIVAAYNVAQCANVDDFRPSQGRTQSAEARDCVKRGRESERKKGKEVDKAKKRKKCSQKERRNACLDRQARLAVRSVLMDP